jgi:ADP-ribose pyrophosphatase YjhB (NUDIX family)
MKKEGLPPSPYAVAALLVSPQGIPLVRDPKKPDPNYWKLPGGRSIGKETPKQALIREIKEEVGLSLKPTDIEIVYEEEREGHTFCLFQGAPVSLAGLKTKGNEGEDVKLFLPEDLKKLSEFFPPHQEILKEIKFF